MRSWQLQDALLRAAVRMRRGVLIELAQSTAKALRYLGLGQRLAGTWIVPGNHDAHFIGRGYSRIRPIDPRESSKTRVPESGYSWNRLRRNAARPDSAEKKPQQARLTVINSAKTVAPAYQLLKSEVSGKLESMKL